jgi:hypothetical protein
MADTINILGKPVKKNVVFVVGGGIILIGGVYYYKQRQSANAAQAVGAAVGSTIDPVTGFEYGSPEDQAALAAMQGGNVGAQMNSSSWVGGQIIGYDQYGNPVYGSGGGSGTAGGFTSNAQWSQAYVAQVGSTGNDAVSKALGAYLNGSPLTTDQISIVQSAIALFGKPPISGADGFPPSFHTIGGTGGGGGGGGTGGTAHNPVTGLHSTDSGFTSVSVAWEKATNATGYLVTATNTGGRVVSSQHVTGTSARVGNLARSHVYTIKVRAQPGSGGSDARIQVYTKPIVIRS